MYVCIIMSFCSFANFCPDCIMHVAGGYVNSVLTESYIIPNRPFSCGNLSFECCIHMINH